MELPLLPMIVEDYLSVIKMFLDDRNMVATGMRAFDIQQSGRGATKKTLNIMESVLELTAKQKGQT